MSHGGRMWITLNYVCFYSDFPFYITEYFPFRMVEDIKQNVGLIFSNCIDIFLKDGRVFKFNSFFNVQEVLNILQHIWKYPPSYLQLDAEDEEDEIGVSKDGGRGGGIWGSLTSSSSSSMNPFASDPDGKKSYYVNVAGSERALDLAETSRDRGIEILNDLDAQGERLDRMEASIDSINKNLDRGDRHIRGIDSASGAVLNLVTRDKTKKNAKVVAREHRAKDKWGELMVQGIELEILLKLQSDDLVEAVLCFQRDKVSVKDMASKRTISQCIWRYTDFKYIILRARPLHVDLRFWDNRTRFRMMTSHVQAITNELFLRCTDAVKKKQFLSEGEEKGGGPVRVLFEPNARPFDFGSYFLTLEVVSGGKEGEEEGKRVVARKNAGMVSLLGDNVDDETKKNVRRAETNFDQIYDRAIDLEKIGEVMEGTLVDQTEQTIRISEKTTRANERMKDQNEKVQAITRDLK
mmetsp:Transcript_16941/g.26404  ORF Transcript_16941/g.26404 Transcript_16941/m.26404 type:complete len:465 (-) Transcript_16941:101-1495(-)